jgi:hypothetical protein
MAGTVNYALMIATLKKWYGENKTRPSKSVEIDGQPAVRKSSFSEMIVSGLTQLGFQAALGGFEFLKGGTEGLNKFLGTLPKELADPAKALAKSAGDAVETVKTGINELIPPGGNLAEFKTTIENGLQSVTTNFINPINDTLTAVKASFTGDVNKLTELKNLYSGSDNQLSTLLQTGATNLGSAVSGAIDKAKAWSDELTLGTGDFSLTDAFEMVNNSSTELLSKVFGIVDAPTLTTIVGTLAKNNLMTDLVTANEKKEEAKENLRKAAAIKYPTITIDVEGVPTTIANPEIELLGINSLSLAEKNTILGNYDTYLQEFETALNDVNTATEAIKTQVQTDQQNIVLTMAAQNSVDNIGTVASTYNSITDPEQKALFETTINPTVRDTTKLVAPLLEQSVTVQIPPVG